MYEDSMREREIEEKVDNILSKLSDELDHIGLTFPKFIRICGQNKAKLLNLSESDQKRFRAIFDRIEDGNLESSEKGRLLEQLTSILVGNSLFHSLRNCRTSTNEVDILVEWSEFARMQAMMDAFPCFGNHFLCECKNYSNKVGVTYVGKFYSLLKVANAKLGIMISWNGLSGRGAWDSAIGLTKKIALKDGISIIAMDKEDLQEIYEGKSNFFSIVHGKYQSLQNDIDYSEFVSKHEAEDEMVNEIAAT